MKTNTRFSVSPASTNLESMQISSDEKNEDFNLKKSIQEHIGESNIQYRPVPMERLHHSPSSVHLDADGIVGKAHVEILPTSTFNLSGISKRYVLSESKLEITSSFIKSQTLLMMFNIRSRHRFNFSLLLLSPIYAAMAVIGFQNRHNCQVDVSIPHYLFFGGICGLIAISMRLLMLFTWTFMQHHYDKG